jgi:hypothetical protein
MLTLAVTVLQRCLPKESRASLAVSNELKYMEIAYMDYCGRDRGMPKGRLYDWEGIAMMGRQNLEIRWVESLLFSFCASSLTLIHAQKTVPVPIRG